MLRALLYLRLMTACNWLLSRGRRLREPKYLLGALAGAAYFHYFLFRPLGGKAASPAGMATFPLEAGPEVAAFAALALLVVLLLPWLVPTGPASLGFTEAEIAFLFPAPLARTSLVHFRLLSSQVRSLLGAMVMTLLSQRWGTPGAGAVIHAAGWWLVFSTVGLHRQGAGFTLARLAGRGVAETRLRLVVAAGISGILLLTWLRLPPTRPDLGGWLTALAGTAPLGWLLAPLRWVVAPFFSPDAASLGPAIALAGLHYVWVARTVGRFEETELGHAQSRAAQVAAWRAGRGRSGTATPGARREPFTLPGRGRPELAFLWKNLLSTWSCFRLRPLVMAAALATAIVAAGRLVPDLRVLLPGLGFLALILGGYTLLVGPQFARQDLRTDLAYADLLKTYPLAGWQIVAGQLLTPLAILTGLLWLELLVAALALPPLDPTGAWSGGAVRTATALGTAMVIPPLVLLQLMVPNAAALLFPGWHQVSRSRGGGPELVGIRMLFFLAQSVAMAAALLPAAITAATLLLVGRWVGGWWPAVVLTAATGTVLVLAAEAVIGVVLLGRLFEQHDLTQGPDRPA